MKSPPLAAQGWCTDLSRAMFSLVRLFFGRPDLSRIWSSMTDASFHFFMIFRIAPQLIEVPKCFLIQLSIACRMKPSTLIRLRTFADQVQGVTSWIQQQYWPRRRLIFLPHSEVPSNLRQAANFKLNYYLSIGLCFISLSFVVWML